MRKSLWFEMSCQRALFLHFIVPCVSIWECIQENSFYPLIFSRGEEKVTLFSFRRASLWGLNQSKFPLCFLFWRDLLLLNAGPLVRPGELRAARAAGCGLWAVGEASSDNTQLVLESVLPLLPLSTPIYLARVAFSYLWLSSSCSPNANNFRA